MTGAETRKPLTIDGLDRQILHAVQVSPRAGFALLGQALGVSEQTVARRYGRLKDAGVVRVFALVDPNRLGQLDWMLRVACRPHAALSVAQALAARTDVSWVSLTGGGSDITASVRARSQGDRDELLLNRLPRTAQVLSMTASIVLNRFGHENDTWTAFGSTLTDEAVAILAAHRYERSFGTELGEPLDIGDQPLIDLLAVDGRASIASLAGATGWSHGRTARRLDALLASGTLYLDVDLAGDLLGYPVMGMLWLTVDPGRIGAMGSALAARSEVTFVAATTGRSNLAASLSVRDVRDLYDFISSVGSLGDGIRELQVEPVIRRVKQAGSLLDGSRLRVPALPPVRR